MKRRVAFVGLGHRANRFIDEIVSAYREAVELVGFCDTSRVRIDAQNRWLGNRHDHPPVPGFAAEDFEAMVRQTRPDTVVVATIDSSHHQYIVPALDLGCDVVTEKPMTVDAAKCRQILDAAGRHPGRLKVAFNYRWSPANSQVKQLIAEGTIGAVKSVTLEWLLDVRHGADYFRRWHSEKENSGGLLVHKATHHFDLVNWWTNSVPATVAAMGGLMFYGKANAVARGQEALTRYARYTGNADAERDPFALDLAANERFRALYLEAEAESGYIRDRNVFREGIDIEDNVSVLVRYRNGLLLTYVLNAFSPREGMRATFSGDRGRIEFEQFAPSSGASHDDDEGNPAGAGLASNGNGTTSLDPTAIRVHPHFSQPYSVPVATAPGGHWGGDPAMWRQLFSSNPPPDTLGRCAGPEQGAASILIGIAANRALATSQFVSIDDVLPLPGRAASLAALV